MSHTKRGPACGALRCRRRSGVGPPERRLCVSFLCSASGEADTTVVLLRHPLKTSGRELRSGYDSSTPQLTCRVQHFSETPP
jgi:hypothetical protein